MKSSAFGLALAAAVLLGGCDEKKPALAPAKVENAVAEASLTTITLTEAAVKRLGIELTAVATQAIPATRILGGELQSLPGQDITMSAPTAGIIVPPGREAMPLPGTTLARGEAVVGFIPLQNSAEASGSGDDLRVREAEYEAARRRLERTEKLVPQRAASPEELETARTDLARAEARLQLARTQRDFTRNTLKPDFSGNSSVVTIGAPVAGVLQALLVANGQSVAAGQQLFHVQGQSPLWVRVRVFSGLLRDMDLTAAVQVDPLSGAGSSRTATPTGGPVTADPATSAVDVYYQMDNADGLFRPGERTLVRLAVKGSDERKTIPLAALFRDIYGGTWVYQNTAANVFVRHRVMVEHTADGKAVFTSGPPVGARIVTAGVAELAGTEFGIGK